MATMTLTAPAIDTCPTCGGVGYVPDGDGVDYCGDPDCTYRWQTQEPAGCDDQPDWRLNAIDCRYRASLGYAES